MTKQQQDPCTCPGACSGDGTGTFYLVLMLCLAGLVLGAYYCMKVVVE